MPDTSKWLGTLKKSCRINVCNQIDNHWFSYYGIWGIKVLRTFQKGFHWKFFVFFLPFQSLSWRQLAYIYIYVQQFFSCKTFIFAISTSCTQARQARENAKHISTSSTRFSRLNPPPFPLIMYPLVYKLPLLWEQKTFPSTPLFYIPTQFWKE